MISEEEIFEWWNPKNENYLKNYAKRNKLTLMQVRDNFFIKTHKTFLETIPSEIKRFLRNHS